MSRFPRRPVLLVTAVLASTLGDGGARWNPCTTIRWSYNPSGGYAGSLDQVREALDRISLGSGLGFTYVGPTTHLERTGTTFTSDPDLAIAWSHESRVASLAGGVVGIGGGYTRTAPDGSGRLRRRLPADAGFVVLDRAHALVLASTARAPSPGARSSSTSCCTPSASGGAGRRAGVARLGLVARPPVRSRRPGGRVRIGATHGCL